MVSSAGRGGGESGLVLRIEMGVMVSTYVCVVVPRCFATIVVGMPANKAMVD